MSATPLEQLLTSYLYSCQPVLPVPYNSDPPPQPTCLPPLIATTLPTYSSPAPNTCPLQLPSLLVSSTTPPYTSPPNQPFSSTSTSPLTYSSPPSNGSDGPAPSLVIHHKPSSYPRPTQHLTDTFYWKNQTEYRTKLMDSSISRTELLDLLTYYPLNPSVSGKTRKKSSSSSSKEKPYIRQSFTNSRTSSTPLQLKCLEMRFKESPTMERDERLELGVQIGVKETAIRTWFQNRRAKQRRADILREQAKQAAETGTVNLDNIPSL